MPVASRRAPREPRGLRSVLERHSPLPAVRTVGPSST